ncbi:MAG: type II toxin-antitoxin system Phd/YefM family antitoxin [Alphaproteobacteria bacterium]|nr:type II toxin-antitoxin system Phd/YefM family antitoxin [Alphaproteobacteria bacterium]
MRVTSAEFMRSCGSLSNHALTEPVTITEDGRDRLVVLSAAEYARLKRRDRQAVLAEELGAADIAAIAVAAPPPEAAQFDGEFAMDVGMEAGGPAP